MLGSEFIRCCPESLPFTLDNAELSTRSDRRAGAICRDLDADAPIPGAQQKIGRLGGLRLGVKSESERSDEPSERAAFGKLLCFSSHDPHIAWSLPKILQGLLDGVEFKQTAYALGRDSREAAL